MTDDQQNQRELEDHLFIQDVGEPAAIPTWVHFADPRDGHHAAFDAWMHTPSRCVLARFWFPYAVGVGGGDWVWRVVHPRGWRRDVPRDRAESVGVLTAAEPIVAEILKAIENAQ